MVVAVVASAPKSLVEVCKAELTLAVLVLLELVPDVMTKLAMELLAAMVLTMVLELAMLDFRVRAQLNVGSR